MRNQSCVIHNPDMSVCTIPATAWSEQFGGWVCEEHEREQEDPQRWAEVDEYPAQYQRAFDRDIENIDAYEWGYAIANPRYVRWDSILSKN